jgi:putative hydrolase of the HAD superfamily
VARLEVTQPLAPFPDVAALRELGVPSVLVTTGFERFQRSKITALGIEALFARIYIDAVDVRENPDTHGATVGDPGEAGGVMRPSGKRAIFSAILTEWGLAPREALVVGDSADSEIAAGVALGIPTVQVLRDGIVRAPEATAHITSLDELPRVIRELGA